MTSAGAVEFDEESVKANIQAVRPGMLHFAVSLKTGAGMQEYLHFFTTRLAEVSEKMPV
jgi:Ni2+-binding GTPase involved in maturation of urease and hydrogenase